MVLKSLKRIQPFPHKIKFRILLPGLVYTNHLNEQDSKLWTENLKTGQWLGIILTKRFKSNYLQNSNPDKSEVNVLVRLFVFWSLLPKQLSKKIYRYRASAPAKICDWG